MLVAVAVAVNVNVGVYVFVGVAVNVKVGAAVGVSVGVSVADTTLGTTVGNLGFEKVEFPKPVFIGDTIYAETEVVEKRESKSRPQWGIVVFEHRATNQRGEVVMKCRRAGMMRKKNN